MAAGWDLPAASCDWGGVPLRGMSGAARLEQDRAKWKIVGMRRRRGAQNPGCFMSLTVPSNDWMSNLSKCGKARAELGPQPEVSPHARKSFTITTPYARTFLPEVVLDAERRRPDAEVAVQRDPPLLH